MKRNWGLIREILSRVEENLNVKKPLQLKDWPEDIHLEISYHVALLIEGNFLNGKMVETCSMNPDDFFVFRLTIQGHNWLNTVKNDVIWNKIKVSFVSKGLSMTFDLIKFAAINLIKKELI